MRHDRRRDGEQQHPEEDASPGAADVANDQEQFTGQQAGQQGHRQTQLVPQQQRLIEPRGVHHRRRKHGTESLRDGVGDAHERRKSERHADVVHGPEAAVALQRMCLRLERAAANQCRVAIVIGEIEVGVERERMRDHQVVGLVAGSGKRPMCDETPHDDENDSDQDPTAHPIGRCEGRWRGRRRSIESFLEKPTSPGLWSHVGGDDLPSDDGREIGWVEVLAHWQERAPMNRSAIPGACPSCRFAGSVRLGLAEPPGFIPSA